MADPQDTQELHESRAEVQRLVKNWRALLDIMPIMLFFIRDDKVIEYLNQSAKDIFGDIRGKSCSETLCGDNCNNNCPLGKQRSGSGADICHGMVEAEIGDLSIECTSVPFDGYNGDNLTMILMRDISNYKRQEQELKVFNENIDDILRIKISELKESEVLRHKLAKEVNILKQKVDLEQDLGGMIGSSRKMRELRETIQQVAGSDAIILITGESGTGKELVADLVRRYSSRHDKMFLKVNCSAINESLLESDLFGYEKGAFTGATMRTKGKFEIADGGTIFLDEIGDISPRMQAALLRVLQGGEVIRVGGNKSIKVDVRIIAATNVDLVQAVEQGKFRLDLYYRLNIIKISLPALRERKDDLMELTTYFVKHYRKVFNKEIDFLPSRIIDLLLEHDWPGNVRELKNVIQRAVLMSKNNVITEADLQFDDFSSSAVGGDSFAQFITNNLGGTLKEVMASFEKEVLTCVLQNENCNVPQTAKNLGVGKTALYDKMKRHGISAKSLKR
jgi:transcriptional regulator with PAS, ATPase and Fis domain